MNSKKKHQNKSAKPPVGSLVPKPKDRNAILMPCSTAAEVDDKAARKLTQPEVMAAVTIRAWTSDQHDINSLVKELETQSAAVRDGEMGRAESMLIAQAHTLDQLFSLLARRAQLNAGEFLGACETYLRLAFKAQSQCRTTIETLAEMKNPMNGAYVRQANVAAGHQQINNGSDGPPVREIENQPNKLSGEIYELRPNTRAPALASRADQALEALGEVNWADDGGRQAAG